MSTAYNIISIVECKATPPNTVFLFRINKNYENSEKLLNSLKQLVKKNKECFLLLDPFTDADLMNDRDYFILYHKLSDTIFGWINVKHSIISSGNDKKYITKIDKIVVIPNFAQLAQIGTFLIKYLLELFNKENKFYNTENNEYVDHNIEYIYLYSLPTTKKFYTQIPDLTTVDDIILTEDKPPNADLIFFKFPHIISNSNEKKIQEITKSLNILHSFEIDEVDIHISDLEITKIDEKCYNLKPPAGKSYISEYIDALITNNQIKILPIITMDKYIQRKRKRTRKDYSYRSKDIKILSKSSKL